MNTERNNAKDHNHLSTGNYLGGLGDRMRNSIIDLLSTGKSYRTWQIARHAARVEPDAKSYINTRPYIKELKNLQADGIIELDPISTGKDKVWRLKRS